MSVLQGVWSREELGRLCYALLGAALYEHPVPEWVDLSEVERSALCNAGEELFMLGCAARPRVMAEALQGWLTARRAQGRAAAQRPAKGPRKPSKRPR